MTSSGSTVLAPGDGARDWTPGPDEDIAAPDRVEHAPVPPSLEVLERIDRRERMRRRRRLMLWPIPIALIMLLVAAKLLAMTIIAHVALGQYNEEDYESSLNTSQLNKHANVVERWKAHYNTGTSALQLNILDQARAELEQALSLARPQDACPIRANLAITIERQGDAALEAGDPDRARALWQEAKQVLAEQHESCSESSSGQPMQQTDQRLDEKLQEQQEDQEQEQSQEEGNDPPEGGDDQPEQPDPGQQQRDDEIEQKMNQNQQERDKELEREGAPEPTRVPKPW